VLPCALGAGAQEKLLLSSDGGKTWTPRGSKNYVVPVVAESPQDPDAARVIAMPTAAVLPEGTVLRRVPPALLP
jgi:hypothetical protein